MKAEKLMIGDLLRISEEGLCIKKGTIVKVCSIDSEARLVYKGKELIGAAHCRPIGDPRLFDGGIWCEYLEPIPLTAEILEKNGFSKTGAYIFEDDYEHQILIYLKDENYTGGAYTYIDAHCGCLDISEMPVDHVHELYHALKLCSIEKEIVI